MQKYSMLVFSRYAPGMEDDYIDWYCGQHVHDLMRIPGFVGFRFYKLSEDQLYGTLADQRYRYLIIWDWETDDVQKIFTEIRERKADGRTSFSPCFDKSVMNVICMPVTEYFTVNQTMGLSVEETLTLVNPDKTRR